MANPAGESYDGDRGEGAPVVIPTRFTEGRASGFQGAEPTGLPPVGLTITREIFGQTVGSFLDSADAGKDRAFAGTWVPSQGETLNGRFVIQCKFTSKRDKILSQSDLADDVEKARRLVQNGRCDCYILLTNAGLSDSTAEDVETLFKSAGIKQVRSFGSTWICQQISENKRLRLLVPRIYGLGDLSQILDERAPKSFLRAHIIGPQMPWISTDSYFSSESRRLEKPPSPPCFQWDSRERAA
jgi:hypothetical protein